MKKKLLFSLFVLIPVLLYVGSKIMLYFEVKALFPYSWNEIHELEHTPDSFPLLSKPELKTKSLTLQFLTFHYPDKEAKLDTTLENAFAVQFKDSSRFVVSYDENLTGLDYLNLLLDSDSTPLHEQLRIYFAKNSIENNFQLLKHVYHLKPQNISWFSNNEDVLIQYSLLSLKQLVMANTHKQGFRLFETPNFKGIMFGSPQKSELITINGFSKTDKQYSLLMKGFNLDEIGELIRRIN